MEKEGRDLGVNCCEAEGGLRIDEARERAPVQSALHRRIWQERPSGSPPKGQHDLTLQGGEAALVLPSALIPRYGIVPIASAMFHRDSPAL